MRFAIRKKFLTTWPGLTIKLLLKHPPHSEASAKGHMDQEQKNLQLTSSPTTNLHDEDLSPLQVADNSKTDDHTPGHNKKGPGSILHRLPIQS